jgi:hypothetical protein
LQKEILLLKTYLAILLFLALSLKPAYYFGQVVYFELNIDYIIQTYCVNTDKPEFQCNGKCHLANQLQFQNDENTTDNNINTIALLECFYPIFNNFQAYSFSEHIINVLPKKDHINQYVNAYSYLRDVSLLKPPIS